MKRLKITAVVLAFTLVIGASVAPAGAYFTDSHNADGGLPIKVEPNTNMQEWYAQTVKHIVISNAESATQDVFVRARIDTPKTVLPFTTAGEGWTATPDADGWYYYAEAVKPGGQTNELTATFTFPTVKSTSQPDGSVYGDNYSAVVIYETTPAAYDKDGNPVPNWNGEGAESGQTQKGGN